MRDLRVARVGCCLFVVCAAMLGSVASASASSASIKAAIESYGSKIDVAEGRVLTAVGEYKTTKNPSGVQSAIGESVAVLSALRSKVQHQSAAKRRAKRAKTKIVAGLHALIVAYQRLDTAYGENVTSPEAAKTEATIALAAVKVGHNELVEGIKLLS